MNLQQKIKKAQSERGFTIVELLIVIVVIGILAAIVIVAFTGVQKQAKEAGFKSDANGIVKVAEGYNADKQTYPYNATAATTKGYYEATTNTVKLPPKVRVDIVSADPGATEAANTPAVAADGTKTYKVWACAGGANVYFWASNAQQVNKAGDGC